MQGTSPPRAAASENSFPPVMDGDPATLVNGGGAAPWLLMCDHASNALPAEYGTLNLASEIFREHVAWDIGALDVTLELARLLDAPAVHANFSRLLIDPNRAPDQPGLVPETSDNIVIPANRDLEPFEIGRRRRAFYDPFHDLIARQLAAMRRRGTEPAIIGIHSFTPIMQGAGRPWQVGILWNRDPRAAQPLIEALRAEPELTVGDNEPYSGRVLGHSMDFHGGANGLPNAVIELRQDLIDTPEKARAWAARMAGALEAIAPRIFPVTPRRF